MPLFLYRCPMCAAEREQLGKWVDLPPWCYCGEPPGETPPVLMQRVPAAASFEITGEGVHRPGFSGARTKL